jgi:PAP2 superfamily
MTTGVQILARSRGDAGFLGLLRKGLMAHGIFYGLVAIYFLVLFLASSLFPTQAIDSILDLGLGLLLFSVPFALVAIIAREFYEMARHDKPKSPIKRLCQRLKLFFSNRAQLSNGLPMFGAMLLFMFAFTLFKAKITTFIPFQWDETLDQWDRTLHFGYRPWELLAPMFNSVPATFILNLNYNIWFLVMNLFWVHFAFYTNPGVARTRFFLSYIVCWMVGGSFLATLMSSAGPCYFAVLGHDPQAYAELFEHLRRVNEVVPVWALDAQNMLWALKQEGSAFGGISAMPSMHNATALLFVLATWNGPKLWRNLLIAHAVLIFLGSIHLGWHYAVDTYLTWPIAVLVWVAMKPVAQWWETRFQVEAFRREYSNV